MHKKGKIGIYILRVLLVVLCLLTVAYIFSNSLKTGEASSVQSSGVTDFVKDCVASVAPESKVANATGSGYRKLHAFVRRMAHFSEFAVLGVLLVCCYFSFTQKKKWLLVLPVALVGVAFADETIQGFVVGRVADMADVIMDILGGLTGGMVALAGILWILFMLGRAKKKKTADIEDLQIEVVVVKRCDRQKGECDGER